MSDLQGKTAVITGGASGIGYAAAEQFIAAGAKVIITGRRPAAVEEASKALGVKGIVADQGNMSDLDNLVSEVKEDLGGLDILVISAAVASYGMVAEISEEQCDDMLNVNIKGTLFTMQKFIPIMNEGSSITNISSINAYSGMPLTCVYAATKAAMNSLTRTAAYELAPQKIRVNCINPGATATPVWGKVGLTEEELEGIGAAMSERIPMKRFGEPHEIANVITFLASDKASFVTGSEYTVDGGTIVNPILG